MSLHEWTDIIRYLAVYILFLSLFLVAVRSLNASQIIAAVQLLLGHEKIYVVVLIVRTTIVRNKLTLMRSSMTTMILVSIKMMTSIEKQMSPVTEVKTNCLRIMKTKMISQKLYLQQKLTVLQKFVFLV